MPPLEEQVVESGPERRLGDEINGVRPEVNDLDRNVRHGDWIDLATHRPLVPEGIGAVAVITGASPKVVVEGGHEPSRLQVASFPLATQKGGADRQPTVGCYGSGIGEGNEIVGGYGFRKVHWTILAAACGSLSVLAKGSAAAARETRRSAEAASSMA
jgi:hypothetical protein